MGWAEIRCYGLRNPGAVVVLLRFLVLGLCGFQVSGVGVHGLLAQG